MSKRTGVSSRESEKTGSDHAVSLSSSTQSPNDSLAFYKFIVESVPIAIVSMDSSLRITGFNHWAEKITGHTPQEALHAMEFRGRAF